MRRYILERYVLREVFQTFLFALTVLTFLFFVGSVYGFVRRGYSFGQIIYLIPFAVPYTLPWSFPVSLLVASALVYGRLVADNEVLAVRVAGIHLGRLAAPALLLGVATTGASLYLQATVIPECHATIKTLAKAFIEEVLTLGRGENKRLVDEDHGVFLFLRRFDGPRVEGVVIHHASFRGRPATIVAERGTFGLDASGQNLCVELENLQVTSYDATGIGEPRFHDILPRYRLSLTPVEGRRSKDKVEFLSDPDLRATIDQMERDLRGGQLPPYAIPWVERRRREAVIELHTRYSMSVACIAFVLVGFPLPILLNKNNRLIPFFAGFVAVTLTFYLPFVSGRTFAYEQKLPAEVALWGGTALTAALGAALCAKAFAR